MTASVWAPNALAIPVYPQLSTLTGASFIGFSQSGFGAVLSSVQDDLREHFNTQQFGAKADNAADDGVAYNRAILECSLRGGGVVQGKKGISKIITPIMVCTNVSLDLRGVILSGTGTNNVLIPGVVSGGVLKEILSEYGTSAQGAGTNFVGNCQIYGGNIRNCAIGIRAHRFNYGCTIENVTFESTCAQSYFSTHSWGLRVIENTLYAPSVMSDFVDWTEVSGNSWEGPGAPIGSTGLTIQGVYGGSYSCFIHSNGFHHWSRGIYINTENSNLTITNNHFEDVQAQISGSVLTCFNATIVNNWFKANLTVAGPCIAISLVTSTNCTLFPNSYTTDGVSTFDAHIIATGSNNIGNKVELTYSPASAISFTKFQLADTAVVTQYGGSNNPVLFQPTVEIVSGTGAYTYEKYKSRYHAVANKIPFCTVTYAGTVATIETWIVCDAYGVEQECAFNFKCSGATTYILSGRMNRLDVVFTTAKDKFSGAAFGGTVVMSNSASNPGFLRITVSGVSAGGNITGWVKEL